MSSFSHIDENGRPRMVDVGHKEKTEREAIAEGWVSMPMEIIDMILSGDGLKGDVLKVAEIAGINATKDTHHLIPLCHPIGIDHVSLECSLEPPRGVYITCKVKASDVTGVEMEALTGVSVAALTVYDMCKAISKGMEIKDIRLLRKTGGKSGDWERTENSVITKSHDREDWHMRSAVLTVSDKGSRGERLDTAGPALCEKLTYHGASVVATSIVPDEVDKIMSILSKWVEEDIDLILVTGGTGLSPRDVTPEALLAIGDKEVPGIGEYMRMKTSVFTERSILSRSIAVVKEKSLIIAMPGSEKAVCECFDTISAVMSHAVDTLKGRTHDCARHN